MSRNRKSIDDRIAELTTKAHQLEARRNALLDTKKTADRKRDARRKIIIGAAVLAHAELDPNFADKLREILTSAVTRDVDRAAVVDLLAAEQPRPHGNQ